MGTPEYQSGSAIAFLLGIKSCPCACLSFPLCEVVLTLPSSRGEREMVEPWQGLGEGGCKEELHACCGLFPSQSASPSSSLGLQDFVQVLGAGCPWGTAT